MPRFKFRLIKNILAAIVALVFIACAAEVALRYYDSQTGLILKKMQTQLPYLTTSSKRYCQLQSLATFKIKNPDTQQITLLKTNSFGLRGEEIQVPKPAGVLRVICLGDERTLAAETVEEKTYCHRLQQLLQSRTRLKVEVVNAGLPDACPLLSFLHLRQSLLGLQPDLVILNFDMTDIADDHQLRRHLVKGADNLPLACAHPSLNKNKKTGTGNHLSSFMLVDWGKSRLKCYQEPSAEIRDLHDIDSPQGRYAWIRDKRPDWSIYIKQALEPIKLIHTLSEGSYARMMVAVAPAPWQISSKASQNKKLCEQNGIETGRIYHSRVPFDMLSNQTQQQNVLYCDSSPYFLQDKKPEQLFLSNDVRLSTLGHELYARVLASFIIAKIPGAWSNYSQPSPQKNMATRPELRRQQ